MPVHNCCMKKNYLFDWSIFSLKSEMHAHMYTHIRKISVFELHDTLLGEDFWPDLLHWGLPWQRSWRCQAAKTRQTGTADRWGTCTCICLSSQQNSCMNFDIHLHVNMVSQNVVCFSGSPHKCTFGNPSLECLNFRVW